MPLSRRPDAIPADLLADLKVWFFVALVLVSVLLVIVLVAFYWFTLRPLQRTVLQVVGHIASMAQALADTSKSLELVNETHREVLRLSGVDGSGPPPDGAE